MQAGEGKLITILAQVVANRNLAAEGIAAALDVESRQVIGIGLHQNRDIQPGKFDGISHAFFVAEIGQNDQHAFDAVTVGFEQVGAGFGMGIGFDGAEFGFVLAKHHAFDIHFLKQSQNILPRFADEVVREKVAVAKNNSQGGFHIFLLNLMKYSNCNL